MTNQFQPDLLEGEYFSISDVTLSRHSLRRTISWPADMRATCRFSLLRLGRCDLTNECHRMR